MKAERRHRISGIELDPVHEAIERDLIRRIRERDSLLIAQILFRPWYRIKGHFEATRPAYPPTNTWEELALAVNCGTTILAEVRLK